MEIKEAIDWLEAIEKKYIHGGDDEFDRKRKESIRLAISALNKQDAKKPTHEATLYRSLTCPHCKNVIDEFDEFFLPGQRIRIMRQHCSFCGQKINWHDFE